MKHSNIHHLFSSSKLCTVKVKGIKAKVWKVAPVHGPKLFWGRQELLSSSVIGDFEFLAILISHLIHLLNEWVQVPDVIKSEWNWWKLGASFPVLVVTLVCALALLWWKCLQVGFGFLHYRICCLQACAFFTHQLTCKSCLNSEVKNPLLEPKQAKNVMPSKLIYFMY